MRARATLRLETKRPVSRGVEDVASIGIKAEFTTVLLPDKEMGRGATEVHVGAAAEVPSFSFC